MLEVLEEQLPLCNCTGRQVGYVELKQSTNSNSLDKGGDRSDELCLVIESYTQRITDCIRSRDCNDAKNTVRDVRPSSQEVDIRC